ncbi:MAG TPA: hypothetical protein VJS37_06730 [Terriglobales bacterium]|nr:hypothetical protein [Terriglobales bacterium]
MYRKSIPGARIRQSDFCEELFENKKLHNNKGMIDLAILYIVGKVGAHHSLGRVYLNILPT